MSKQEIKRPSRADLAATIMTLGGVAEAARLYQVNRRTVFRWLEGYGLETRTIVVDTKTARETMKAARVVCYEHMTNRDWDPVSQNKAREQRKGSKE